MVRLLLQGLSGQSYKIEARDRDTIGHLRKVAQDHFDVQELIFVNETLGDFVPDDSAVLEDVCRVYGSEIRVVVMKNCFYDVTVYATRSYNLRMKPLDTIKSLRVEIEKDTSISFQNQVLVWKGKRLDERQYLEKSLKEVGFKARRDNRVDVKLQLRGG